MSEANIFSDFGMGYIGGGKSYDRPSISRSRENPESLIMPWGNNKMLMRSANSNSYFSSLSKPHTLIFNAPLYQNKKDVNTIKMDPQKQRCMTKFFLQGKRYQAIYGELSGVLEEAAVSLAAIKRGFQRFKAGNFPLDDENRPRRSLSDLGQVMSQFLRDEPFLSARVLAKRLATIPCSIKKIVARDLDMRRLPRKWVSHELTTANRVKQVEDVRTLLQVLRRDSEKNLAEIMTGDESGFYFGYDSPIMF
jgi:hypothetical protein